MLSKFTGPLVKLVRTTEGVLVIAFNLVIGAAAIFGSLPGVQAVKYAAIVNSATVLARSGLKGLAALSSATGLTPIEPSGLPADLTKVPELGTNDPALESSRKPDAPASVAS